MFLLLGIALQRKHERIIQAGAMLHLRNIACFALCFFFTATCALAQTTELRLLIWRSEAPQVWNQAVEDFQRQHPGVKIVTEIGPQSSTQLHDLLTQKLKNRDTRLDVFLMDSIWPGEFASAGWALPLERYFGGAEQEKFLRSAIQANRYRGQIFGVPLFIDAGVLYYRKDLLEKHSLA